MLIIAGHLRVDPADRDAYVAACSDVVIAARSAPGCLDFAITADTLDPGRVCIHERWESEPELLRFRESGPGGELSARVLDADVRRFDVTSESDP
ncbi:MAG: putative quinol monooxygenase [Acidimicrobiales bacterium]